MSIYPFTVRTIDGQSLPLESFRGQALLVVNVASKCGFTPQYAGLEALYQQYKDKGFQVLGFPCNQFMGQEPGNEAEIKSFCTLKYNVSFPMFGKVKVNGTGTDPLYQYLKSAKRGSLWTSAIKWNFTKFLVDRQGNVIRRFGPMATAKKIEKALLPLLEKP